MNSGQVIIFALLVLIVTFGVQILTLIYGWGLEPKSWGIIIGSWVFTLVLYALKDMK